jgi:hypothetical protein
VHVAGDGYQMSGERRCVIEGEVLATRQLRYRLAARNAIRASRNGGRRSLAQSSA